MYHSTSGMDCTLTDLHVDFPHSTSATKIRFKVDNEAYANLLPFKVLKHIEPSITVKSLCSTIDHSLCLYAYNNMSSNSSGINTSRYPLATKLRLFISLLLTPDSIQ